MRTLLAAESAIAAEAESLEDAEAESFEDGEVLKTRIRRLKMLTMLW